MKFWQIEEPPGSDYKHVWVSGKLYHPFRLPSVECDVCGETVSSFNAVLPYECPTTMREHPLFSDHDATNSVSGIPHRATKRDTKGSGGTSTETAKRTSVSRDFFCAVAEIRILAAGLEKGP